MGLVLAGQAPSRPRLQRRAWEGRRQAPGCCWPAYSATCDCGRCRPRCCRTCCCCHRRPSAFQHITDALQQLGLQVVGHLGACRRLDRRYNVLVPDTVGALFGHKLCAQCKGVNAVECHEGAKRQAEEPGGGDRSQSSHRPPGRPPPAPLSASLPWLPRLPRQRALTSSVHPDSSRRCLASCFSSSRAPLCTSYRQAAGE